MFEHHGEPGRGILSCVEFKDIKFQPKRMYFIHGVPKGEVRGKHGHREDEQYLTCVKGQIRVKLTTKDSVEETVLNAGDSIFVDTLTWGEQEYLTDNAVLLVLCSTNFDKSEYIYDINEILNGK